MSAANTEELIKKLRDFPQFISHDGGSRWYRSGKQETVCQQAADTIEALQREIERLEDAAEDAARWYERNK